MSWKNQLGKFRAELFRASRAATLPLTLRRVRNNLEVIRRWEAPPPTPLDLTVVSLAYNGESQIETFVEHHLALGASHIVLLDNGSKDQTIEVARRLDRVTVLRCALPYVNYGSAIRRVLTDDFGRGGWVLLADIDERLAYPHSETVPLPEFLRYLNSRGFTSVCAQLLDLFPDGPLDSWPRGGRELVEAACWCDLDNFERLPLPGAAKRNHFTPPEPIQFRGGVRARCLGGNPNLTKFPLLSRVGANGPRLESAHFVSGGRVADVTCLLLHYKFDAGFHDQCVWAVKEKNYFGGSIQYRNYLKALQDNPALNMRDANSRRYTSATALLPSGIVAVSETYRRLAAASDAEPAAAAQGLIQ